MNNKHSFRYCKYRFFCRGMSHTTAKCASIHSTLFLQNGALHGKMVNIKLVPLKENPRESSQSLSKDLGPGAYKHLYIRHTNYPVSFEQ
jgi:hypothetical protein